ncbi:MAG: LuxR C-terminal-related transcriptional regulator [Arachnia sp.]
MPWPPSSSARATISIKTVTTHIGNLLAKLHARDRAQLGIAAYESGAISPAHPDRPG